MRLTIVFALQKIMGTVGDAFTNLGVTVQSSRQIVV